MSDLESQIFALSDRPWTLGDQLRAGKKKLTAAEEAIAADRAGRQQLAATAKADPGALEFSAVPTAPAVEPKAIPIGTPTPAVTTGQMIVADRLARMEAAQAARDNPSALSFAPATPAIEPKLIPIGTPTPAVSPEQVEADRLARLEAAKAWGALGAGGASGQPVSDTVPPVAQAAEQVPPIAQQASAVVTPGGIPTGEAKLPEQEMQQKVQLNTAAIVEQVKNEPKIGEKILKLAKDTGRGILELIQGFAYGMAQSDRPLASEIRAQEKEAQAERDAQAANAEAQRTFQQQMATAEQDFNMRVAQLQDDWQNRRFSATTEAEKQEADRERTFAAEQAQKDRDASFREAQLAAGARSAAAGQSAQGDLQGIIAGIVEQLKGK